MGWFTEKVGNLGRGIGSFFASLWHKIVLVVTVAVISIKRTVFSELKRIYPIVLEVIADYNLSDLSDTRKRRGAFKDILSTLKDESLITKDKIINLAIELVVNGVQRL